MKLIFAHGMNAIWNLHANNEKFSVHVVACIYTRLLPFVIETSADESNEQTYRWKPHEVGLLQAIIGNSIGLPWLVIQIKSVN
jgi:hypothetical protein